MNCNIIKDLMVLYASGECSDESKAAILEHTKTCPGCREIWKTMETGELENALETEKETEFQQLTKEIQKENTKHTAKTGLIIGLCILVIFVIGTIMGERNNPVTKASNVTTGKVVYWENNQRGSFSYNNKDYVSLEAEELAHDAFDGKTLQYFYYFCNWDIVNDRSKAVFNVQDNKQGLLDDLLLNNNRATMYETECPIEENLYISSRGYNFFMPATSKQKVCDYYGNENNYTWGLYEWLLDAENNSLCETEKIELKLTKTEVEALVKMVSAPVKKTTIDWEGDEVNADDSVELEMTSKDGTLKGRMSINKYKGEWYTSAYVYVDGEGEERVSSKLPKTIGDKIDALLGQDQEIYVPVDKEKKMRSW